MSHAFALMFASTSRSLTLTPAATEAAGPGAEPGALRRWLPRLGYGTLALVVLASLAFNIFQPIKVLPRVHLAPGFALEDGAGRPVNSESYRGRFALYGFTTAACDDCPDTNTVMASLRDRLEREALPDVDMSVVSLTLGSGAADPAAPRTADEVRVPWDVLRGDASTMKYIVGGGFGQYYELGQTPEGTTVARFDPMYVLVDGWGIVRAQYRKGLDEERVLRDLAYLAAELGHQEGLGRLAYEAAHLFRCYP